MKRGRGPRYSRVCQGEKRRYPGNGESERRQERSEHKRVGAGSQSYESGERRDASSSTGGREARVRDRLEGRVVWPSLTEGYVRKSRNKQARQQYERTYREGRPEPQTRKSYVGRKRVRASLERPRKYQKRVRFVGMGRQQDHRSAWERVDIQRSREYWKRRKNKEGIGTLEKTRSGGLTPGDRVSKRSRRKSERARNLYEYSTRRRVEKEIIKEREEAIRKRKEGGDREPRKGKDLKSRREGYTSLASYTRAVTSNEEKKRRVCKEEEVGAEEREGECRRKRGYFGVYEDVQSREDFVGAASVVSEEKPGERVVSEANPDMRKGEVGRRPHKVREERGKRKQGGKKREAAKVGAEGRQYTYGRDSAEYRGRYTEEVGKWCTRREVEERQSIGVGGKELLAAKNTQEKDRKKREKAYLEAAKKVVQETKGGVFSRAMVGKSAEMRRRLWLGKGTYEGGRTRSPVRQSKGAVYTGRGEGYYASRAAIAGLRIIANVVDDRSSTKRR